ncbi:corrinoid ABC transporter substrate-binding protein [Planctomycetes bacterium Pan216]|uniref:Corrinoid ABC transporter substrate-binding protein n=1 Tax=Kolteria novifilia TaxID=2527975 RepID=A0A518AYJ1_9BACT|nr:corrinoid ABC transporter substrate-binding protein [Planctomycetes bacterium Pan216]
MSRTLLTLGTIGLLFLAGHLLTTNAPRAPMWLGVPNNPGTIVRQDFPVTVTDGYGHPIRIDRPPQRIVSLMLATDEILLELVDHKRITALTPIATTPSVSNCVAEAKGFPTVVGTSLERIISLRPDIVLAARFTEIPTVSTLKQAGITTFRFGRYETLADIRHNIKLLGVITDERERASEILHWMSDSLGVVAAAGSRAAAKPRVLLYRGGFSAGAATLFDEMLTAAGGTNVAVEAGLVGHGPISKELAIALDPEVIVMTNPYAEGDDPPIDPRSSVIDDPSWQGVTAVRHRRVHLVPAPELGCISHHIVRGALALGRVIHPTLFENVEIPAFPSQSSQQGDSE